MTACRLTEQQDAENRQNWLGVAHEAGPLIRIVQRDSCFTENTANQRIALRSRGLLPTI